MESHPLFHVSEESNLGTFIPRPVASPDVGVTGSVVWTIDDAHLPNYLVPRDCPRVCFRIADSTTEADRARFVGDSPAQHVIVLETGWRSRAQHCRLYVYEFSAGNFEMLIASAGYYVSRVEVKPLRCIAIDEPLKELARRNVEVRFVRDLSDLRNSIIRSSLEFSIIRFRNAGSTKSSS